MYICDGCGNSNIILKDGVNTCPECGRVIVVSSFKSDSPTRLPDDINSLSSVDLTRIMSNFILNLPEIWIVAEALGISGNIRFELKNYPDTLFSLCQTIKRFYGDDWKEKARPIIIQWLCIKQTTP